MKSICWKYFGNYIWKFFGNYVWKIFGNLLMETFCWIPAAFRWEEIMSQGYGTILRFQGNGTWSTANEKKSGSADLSRTMPSERSYRKGEQGDGVSFP